MTIGIFEIGSQSGRAYFADYINRGYRVIGYIRQSPVSDTILEAIRAEGGIYLERPENSNHEQSHFVPLGESEVTTDLAYMIARVDMVIVSIPSMYHISSVREMAEAGLMERRVPIILSPSRTIATPYVWKILGEGYPVVCFATCPYSCKAPAPNVSLIKRRKRTWTTTLEGHFTNDQKQWMRELFPQAAISRIPAITSLNNIGAVFHCATYLLNIDEIKRREQSGEVFSFYMDGIAARPEVGGVLEEIDQVRLGIADALGFKTFGLRSNPREDVWRKLTNALRALEEESEDELDELRKIRRMFTEFLSTSITSGQHWLDITYGVIRREGESLSEAIGRTPTYQKNSVPQERYLQEDIPTGLVPFEALAQMLGVDCTAVTRIIDAYDNLTGGHIREKGRNLKEFEKEYIINYLKGNLYYDNK